MKEERGVGKGFALFLFSVRLKSSGEHSSCRCCPLQSSPTRKPKARMVAAEPKSSGSSSADHDEISTPFSNEGTASTSKLALMDVDSLEPAASALWLQAYS